MNKLLLTPEETAEVMGISRTEAFQVSLPDRLGRGGIPQLRGPSYRVDDHRLVSRETLAGVLRQGGMQDSPPPGYACRPASWDDSTVQRGGGKGVR